MYVPVIAESTPVSDGRKVGCFMTVTLIQFSTTTDNNARSDCRVAVLRSQSLSVPQRIAAWLGGATHLKPVQTAGQRKYILRQDGATKICREP
jgi:hypothetical protein